MTEDQQQHLIDQHPKADAEQPRANTYKNSVFYGELRKIAMRVAEILGGLAVAAAIGLFSSTDHKYLANSLMLIGLSLVLFGLYLQVLPATRKQHKAIRARIKRSFIATGCLVILVCGGLQLWWLLTPQRIAVPATAISKPVPLGVEPPKMPQGGSIPSTDDGREPLDIAPEKLLGFFKKYNEA